ncbi:MAG: putative toxin-antitoxin system toxin component, PIN family [Bacteroidetes bacterium]|nr:putative toxin-antitoxin system toxin component, PIN family [Bacteroidota bacterium]
MKIILDTNILISSFIFKGKAQSVHSYCVLYTDLYISKFLYDELFEKLEGKFSLDETSLEDIKTRTDSDFEMVVPSGTIPEICRDKDDNNILHLAKFIHADFIITGDHDLLDLKFFKKTEIISPAVFFQNAL